MEWLGQVPSVTDGCSAVTVAFPTPKINTIPSMEDNNGKIYSPEMSFNLITYTKQIHGARKNAIKEY